MKFPYIFVLFILFLSCNESKQTPAQLEPEANEQHKQVATKLIQFFDQNAYQPNSGVYLSEIDNQGKTLSHKVYNVALSRAIYGLAYASVFDSSYLKKAETMGQFLTDHLTARDSVGNYFASFYDLQAERADSSQSFDIWQQAYGLCGLSELYRLQPDDQLLSHLQNYHEDFVARFHDKTHGGFYGNYDSSGQVSGSKSLQSLMYPITAYMENLWKADAANRAKYEPYLKENLAIAYEKVWNKDLNWVNIKFDDVWTACAHESAENPCFTVTPGHNFQFASLLLRTKDWDFLSEAEKNKYQALGLEILKTTLAKPIFPQQDLSQGFYSEVNPVNNAIVDDRKTWWQHCEALIALSLAGDRYVKEIATLEAFYFEHFPDKVNGGEFFYLDAQNVHQTDELKGSIGKSLYHTVEMMRFLGDMDKQ